ncbi:hypothetical protein EYF80_046623 [Liparis tanakae]|uniref:Uncharacterized protein n=1 Tax=Liparis tanakae TaxID=230148 RepID=A0A4Z2FPM2_9TELE|nr:hypothetical protein EYF80_046623 [Liparis tanakae]
MRRRSAGTRLTAQQPVDLRQSETHISLPCAALQMAVHTLLRLFMAAVSSVRGSGKELPQQVKPEMWNRIPDPMPYNSA